MTLDDLLSRYDAARAAGERLTPEDLCRETPELLETVRYHVRALDAVNGLPQMVTSAAKSAAIESLIRVDALHGKGGLGEVYRATDNALGRVVALKVVARPNDARFEREAAITGQLEHPGIVPVHGRGTTDNGRPCYTMRFVAGPTLGEAIERFHAETHELTRSNAQFRELLTRFISVCNTVAFAHSRGIIHRDLKPANVLLGDFGETLVIDWGLAKFAGVADGGSGGRENQDANLTHDGAAIGTPAFMSPEQTRGEPATVASDIYALGGILRSILAGHDCTVPDQIAGKALAPVPQDRYADARDLAAEVERWLADEPVLAAPDSPAVRVRRWARKHRVFVNATAAVMLVATIGAALAAVVLGAKNRELQNAVELATEREREAIANFQMACDAVDQFSFHAGDNLRQREHDLEHLRTRLLKSAGELYQKRSGGGTPMDRVRAHARLGWIALQTNDRAAAEAEFRLAIHDAMVAPRCSESLALESDAWAGLTEAYAKALKHTEAIHACRRSRDLKQESFPGGVPQNETDRAELASLEIRIGQTLFASRGDNPEAEDAFRNAIVHCRQNFLEHPKQVKLWKDYITALIHRGTMRIKVGKHQAGESDWNEVRTIAEGESEITRDPDRLAFRTQLAVFCYGTGNDWRERQRFVDAEPYLIAARNLYASLAAAANIPSYHIGHADAVSALALLRKTQGNTAAANDLFTLNIAALDALHRNNPDERSYRERIVNVRYQLALLALSVPNLPMARDHLAATERVLRPVLADVPLRKTVIQGWTKYLAVTLDADPAGRRVMWEHILTHIRDLSGPESATEAVELLEFMRNIGGFSYPENLERLRGREFEGLKSRSDFQALMSRIELKP